jgi:hypothetical protein
MWLGVAALEAYELNHKVRGEPWAKKNGGGRGI